MQDGSLPTSAQVERALEDVYARPYFAETDTVTLMERIREMAWSALRWVFELVGGLRMLEASSPVIFWIIVAWLAISAVAILGHLLYTAYSAVQVGEHRRASGAGPTPAPDRPTTAADWEEAARRAAADGRYREAAVALYHALVLRLDARGAVRYDAAKTPGDYRREVRRHPDAARVLTSFLRSFEPVVFGGRDLGADGYERLRAAAAEGGAGG